MEMQYVQLDQRRPAGPYMRPHEASLTNVHLLLTEIVGIRLGCDTAEEC